MRDDCFEFYEKADYNLEQEIEKIQFTHTDEIIISYTFFYSISTSSGVEWSSFPGCYTFS